MPTISVNRELLFDFIGKKFSKLEYKFNCGYFIATNINTHGYLADEKFDELCFEFGIELDDVVKEPSKTKPGVEETIYKVEIPANRYDLLCVEGLGRALSIFLEK